MIAESPYPCADLSVVSDSVLVDSTLRGNHAAYAQLVSRYQDRLHGSLMAVVQSADLAEELVHAAFVQAYLKLDTFRRQANFSTWLYRIAYNKFLSMKRAKRNTTSLRSWESSRQIEPIDPSDSPEQLCLRFEEISAVHDALARLDSRSRAILVLRELNELSYEEISEVLKMKLGTVRSQLSRARSKLHQELSR